MNLLSDFDLNLTEVYAAVVLRIIKLSVLNLQIGLDDK